jgi:membrane protein YdbS with pleckstrin-like domain
VAVGDQETEVTYFGRAQRETKWLVAVLFLVVALGVLEVYVDARDDVLSPRSWVVIAVLTFIALTVIHRWLRRR